MSQKNEPKEYIWSIPVITNLKRKKNLVIVEKLNDINKRDDLFEKYLFLSRYGIPCYIFDNNSENCVLSHTNSKDFLEKRSEYFIIDDDFINKISFSKPEIYVNKSKLNANAEEFIPTQYNLYYYYY